jgi:hypothetical protein
MSSPQKFILTIFLSVLMVAGALGVFWFLFVSLGRLEETQEFHLGEAARLEEKRKNIRGTLQILKSNPVGADRLNAFLVNRERPLAFIEGVEQLAKYTGNSVSIDLIESQATKDALAFRLTVEGELPRLIRYLALLENMPYGVSFEEFSYQRTASELIRASGGKEIPPSRLILLLKVKTL